MSLPNWRNKITPPSDRDMTEKEVSLLCVTRHIWIYVQTIGRML